MASTRLRPSSIPYSPFVRFSLAPHFDPAQYLKRHIAIAESEVEGRVGRNDNNNEAAAAAVVVELVVMATLAWLQI
jgi:hypothetical protein